MTFFSTEICPNRLDVTGALPLVYPGALPVTVAVPTVVPVKVKVPIVLPAAINNGDPAIVTTPAGEALSAMETPGAGAAALNRTVPLIVRVRPTVAAESVKLMVGVPTFTTAVPGR